MAADLIDTLINTGGGAGGGAAVSALIAKYFSGKSEKEIEEIKKQVSILSSEIASNKEADAIRDTAIELLKKDAENNNKSNEELKAFFIKLDEKLDKKFDQIMERLNNA